MPITNEKKADLTANGDSDWVPLNSPGQVVQVDCVDAEGNSASWGSVSATLLYSVDGKMRSIEEGPDGYLITGKTQAFTYTFSSTGFVAVAGTGFSDETLRIKVGQASRK